MMDKLNIDQLDWQKTNGLLPAIVQHAGDGRVLMLGYMNRQALEKTLESGRVTFFSRSRRTLWTKGETSGHWLKLESVMPDCDSDALLVQAVPEGPTCHLGTETCFGDSSPPGFLPRLERIIQARRDVDPETSYTARLLSEGVERCARKVGEEGVETALAAVTGNPDELENEAADLVYHLLVCLTAAGTNLDGVVRKLKARHELGPRTSPDQVLPFDHKPAM